MKSSPRRRDRTTAFGFSEPTFAGMLGNERNAP
jgi:hypothetical protein